MIRTLLAVVLSIFSISVYAQEIKSISFDGIVRTKEVYLRQFITSQEGAQLDSAQLEKDRQTLVNLEILSNVTVSLTQQEDGVEVIFQCSELRTLLPIFSFGGIQENFWIQAGFSEVNLGGRGNKLTTYYQYYDRSSYATHLRFDRIKQSEWGLGVNIVHWETLEPLYFGSDQVDYEYKNNTYGFDVIKHFSFQDKIEFGIAFFTEEFIKITAGEFDGAPDRVRKDKVLGKVSHTFNRLNYHFFYLDGWHNQLNLQTVQSLNNDPSFYILFNDIKRFARVGGKGNFAARFRFGLSSNQDTPFAPFVLDSYVNIRGIGNRVDRGTGAIILNAEFRQTVVERPKTALQAVVFSDTGSWRNPGGEFSDFGDSDNFVLFAGGGLRLIHKEIFNAIFRIDYGFNLQSPESNGFVLGIGQYF